jgi:GAF domain-containing protein
MLTVALDGIIELSGAERGLLLLFDDTGRLLMEKARTHDRRDLAAPCLPVSRTVLERVRRRGIPFWDDGAPAATEGDERRRLFRHLMVASIPIHAHGRLCGLVYLDHSGAALRQEALMLARSLAQLASLAALRGAERSWRWRCVDATRWSLN